jgi:hypothetical protein
MSEINAELLRSRKVKTYFSEAKLREHVAALLGADEERIPYVVVQMGIRYTAVVFLPADYAWRAHAIASAGFYVTN